MNDLVDILAVIFAGYAVGVILEYEYKQWQARRSNKWKR